MLIFTMTTFTRMQLIHFLFIYFAFAEKELKTPPLNGLILPGITRDSILHLTRQWGQFKVTEGKVTMPELCEMLNQGRVSFANRLCL